MQVMPPNAGGGPSRLFILRPVATTLLMVAILLAGIIGYRALPVSALPEVDYPTIQVVTLYPGASPDVVTSAITAPLERQFGQMSGLKQMASQSSGGASVVTLQFQLALPLDVAEQEVQAAINSATNLLPTDLPYPPIYSKVNPADPPILTLAVTSTAMPMTQVEDMVETRVAQKISQVTGVGLVTLAGGQRPAVRVKLNAAAVAAYGLNSETIRAAISNANVNSAKGSLDGPTRSVTLSANDQMKSADDYRQLIVAYQNGAAIRLQDIATIEQGAENTRLAAWANKQQAIVLNIQRQPGVNVITTADSIREMLPTLIKSLPKSVDVKVLTDRTTTIRASVSDVQFELLLAIALVVMVIYVFLRNVPATIIPSVAVPLSLVGTFAAMYFLGFSINNLTLMALTIATGFVVDDAIVVIENISRYIEKGEKPLDAALKGAGEIGFTIISLTFSLVAVLIPLLFMGDIVGRLFGGADRPHLAGLDKRIERRQRLFQRRIAVIVVRLIKIDIIGLQATQRVLHRLLNIARRQPLLAFAHRFAHLGGDDHLVALAALLQPFADDGFRFAAPVARRPAGINVGGIDKVELIVHQRIQQAERGRLIRRPAEHVATEG